MPIWLIGCPVGGQIEGQAGFLFGFINWGVLHLRGQDPKKQKIKFEKSSSEYRHKRRRDKNWERKHKKHRTMVCAKKKGDTMIQKCNLVEPSQCTLNQNENEKPFAPQSTSCQSFPCSRQPGLRGGGQGQPSWSSRKSVTAVFTVAATNTNWQRSFGVRWRRDSTSRRVRASRRESAWQAATGAAGTPPAGQQTHSGVWATPRGKKCE